MSSIKERVIKEKERSDIPSARVVHLYLEGNFYRAYEWSAWLCATRINNFKVSNKSFNGIDGTVSIIGFPPTSLQKFCPEGAEIINVSDSAIDMILPDTVIPDRYEIKLMHEDFDEWKKSLPPVSENKSNRHQHSDLDSPKPCRSSPNRLTDVMHEILIFDVNKSTPFECMTFISEIQKQLISLKFRTL